MSSPTSPSDTQRPAFTLAPDAVAPFDEALAARLQRRALDRSPGGNFLMAHLATELEDRLAAVQRHFQAVRTLFTPDPQVRAVLGRAAPDARLNVVEWGDDEGSSPSAFVQGAPQSDLVVSLLAMQSVNDLPGFLVQARRSLVPDGLFLGCMLGAGSLGELRETLIATEIEMLGGASPRVAPFADLRDVGALLQRAGFALPVADAEALTLRHDSLFGLIADLRLLGFGNALNGRSRRPLTRAFWARAAAAHAERFAGPDGRIPATLNIIWLSGWSPAPSQPRALKPGSATISLKDVL
jgi:SAM-dependent methyltransferase